MKDINGKELAVGQTVIVACKDQKVANVPVIKKAKILEIRDDPTEDKNEYWTDGYIRIKYLESGRKVTIDGYLYMTDKRFCIID